VPSPLRALILALITGLALACTAAAHTLLFPRPSTYVLTAAGRCSSEVVHVMGSPSTKTVAAPGRPGLAAERISQRVTRVRWSVGRSAACKTATLLVSVGRYGPHWLPTTVALRTNGRTSGTVTIRTSPYLATPDVAIASAFSRADARSPLAAVLIRP
jgi:hypothetical protein